MGKIEESLGALIAAQRKSIDVLLELESHLKKTCGLTCEKCSLQGVRFGVCAFCENEGLKSQVVNLQVELGRVSEELGLPPGVGPAPGELRRLAEIASANKEVVWKAAFQAEREENNKLRQAIFLLSDLTTKPEVDEICKPIEPSQGIDWSGFDFPKCAGYNEREWRKCRNCGVVVYRDYLPNSLESPIITMPCGHRFEDSDIIAEQEAFEYFTSKDEGCNSFTRQQLESDVEFLAKRANSSGCWTSPDNRSTGASANSIVGIAYGTINPGNQRMPGDQSDLDSCVRAVERLPEHRRTQLVYDALNGAKRHLAIKHGLVESA